MIAKEGPACFDKFRGDTPFVFSGTYLWVQDDKVFMHVHPTIPRMEGRSLVHLKDITGKLFLSAATQDALNNPEGAWATYLWPKPGEKEPFKKVSFLKKTTYNGKIYIVGCGVYDDSFHETKK